MKFGAVPLGEASGKILGHNIAGPDGREEADAGRGPGLIFADVELGRVRAAQKRLPYLRDRHLLRF